jgi:outer membrane protein assembly complex protein YaeT
MLRFTRDSKTLLSAFAALAAVLVFLGFIFPLSLRSQERENPATVNSISVLIDGQPASPELLKLVPIREGDLFSVKNISDSIRKIFKTGLFLDVKVEKQGEENVDLLFILTKQFFIRKIIYFGASDIPRKLLDEGLYALSEGSPFSIDRLEKAMDELRAVLKKEGYLYASIDTHTEKDETISQIDVLFHINTGTRYWIEKILFKGDILVNKSELIEKMETREGKTFIPSRLENDIKRIKEIYHAMDYRNVEITVEDKIFDNAAQTLVLTLRIVPREKIEIVIQGADVPLKLLKPIWETKIFEEWGLSEGEAKIVAYLRKKGYLFPQVTSTIQREGSSIQIIHKVDRKKHYILEDVKFRGLHYFSASRIKRDLSIRDNIPLISRINGARLFEIPAEIKLLYETYGFADTQVVLNFELHGIKATPIFIIQEGQQNKIKAVGFEGISLFNEEQLLQQVNTYVDGPFFQPNVQKDIERLETFYLNQGVRETEVRASVEVVGENLFSIYFQIREGRFVKINTVVITGNKMTKKKTILREVLLKTGDLAFYSSIRETKRRLEKLGIFTEVRLEEVLLTEGIENLLILVREGERNYAGLGLGVETVSEPRSFEIWNNAFRLRGTAEYIRSNLFGSASQLSFVGQVSLREQRVVLSWEQPYFFGMPVESFLNGWVERRERKSYGFDRRGVSLTAIKSLSGNEEMMLSGTLRLARTTLYKLEIPESGVDRQHFPYSTTSVSGSFIWDKRNDPFNPEKGFFLSSVVEWAYPLFKTESNYLKIFSKYQNYKSILPGLVFSATARLGLGRGRIPIHERFFGGGSNSFRGVDYDELGPKDPDSSKPIGGKAMMILNFELTFPLIYSLKNLSGAVFYDIGNVFELRRQVSLQGLQNAVGLGLRYKTPLGPIRLELGWNLDAPEGQNKARVHITIGNIF